MNSTLKAKLLFILIAVMFLFFFSNDFGLIDVEKTSIITAIAIDKEQNEFVITAQIAVPEATDANTENLKTQLVGKGSTVGGALSDLGNVSGWFPKLAFCNLIILGNSLTEYNVIDALDYFAKTLRIQDSALVALSEKSASELLSISTPLDNISSFALQKIMFKTRGFDRDVASSDIKSFCSGHYSKSKSAYMPLIKILPSGDESSSSGGSSGSSGGSGGSSQGSGAQNGSQGGQQDSKKLFDARTTALFLDGYKVGELDTNLTLTFNALYSNFTGTTIPVEQVPDENGQSSNYLLTVMSSKPKVRVKADENGVNIDISLKLYCKISDHAIDGSTEALAQNSTLPTPLKEKTENMLEGWVKDLIETQKQTKCDIFNIVENIYRKSNKFYDRYKDDYLDHLTYSINIAVDGQK